MRSIYRLSCLLAFTFACIAPCIAQDAPPKILNLVLVQGDGAIAVPVGQGWKLQQIFLYDRGSRPVVQLRNEPLDMDLSFILFPNDTGAPTAESCRAAVMKPAIKAASEMSQVIDIKDTVRPGAGGNTLAIASHFIPNMESVPIHQENVFGFYGDSHNCAEIHISQSHYTANEETALFDQLKLLSYDAAYKPVAHDYLTLASIFYQEQAYGAAAWYYTSAVANLPKDGSARDTLRLANDQLVMSLGISGDLKGSRLAAQQAVAIDPGYAMTYYLLACDDAEEGHADAARLHLQQAFDRKANVLPGEKLPDPTKDDSILKLQKNRKFWTFVEDLQATR